MVHKYSYTGVVRAGGKHMAGVAWNNMTARGLIRMLKVAHAPRTRILIAALANIAQDRDKVANRACEDKQVPDTMSMFQFIVMIEYIKNDTQGVGEPPCG